MDHDQPDAEPTDPDLEFLAVVRDGQEGRRYSLDEVAELLGIDLDGGDETTRD